MIATVTDERSKFYGQTGLLIDIDAAGDLWLRFDNGEKDCFAPSALGPLR